MMRLLRVGAFAAFVSFLGASLLLKEVSANVDELMLGVGAELMAYPGSSEEVRVLRLNGARIYLQTQTVNAELSVVLDHYLALCERRDAHLAEQLSAGLERHPNAPLVSSPLGGVATEARREDRRGYVACLDMGDRPKGLAGLARDFNRFVQTGDLSQVGHVRYAYAAASGRSRESGTFLTTIWTDSAFDVYKLLPLRGADAHGKDVDDVPRPPRSQRILSSWEEGSPSGVTVYTTSDSSTEALERFYRDALVKRDWRLIERRPGERLRVNETRIVAAEKGNHIVSILVHEGTDDRRIVTILGSDAS